jgi:hypothetical protein
MNPNNHGTLEACKRLADAGIVLETDAYWTKKFPLSQYELHREGYYQSIPAVQFAEVWRELPEGMMIIGVTGKCSTLWIEEDSEPLTEPFQSNNPTDALIHLLIWVRKEGKG